MSERSLILICRFGICFNAAGTTQLHMTIRVSMESNKATNLKSKKIKNTVTVLSKVLGLLLELDSKLSVDSIYNHSAHAKGEGTLKSVRPFEVGFNTFKND